MLFQYKCEKTNSSSIARSSLSNNFPNLCNFHCKQLSLLVLLILLLFLHLVSSTQSNNTSTTTWSTVNITVTTGDTVKVSPAEGVGRDDHINTYDSNGTNTTASIPFIPSHSEFNIVNNSGTGTNKVTRAMNLNATEGTNTDVNLSTNNNDLYLHQKPVLPNVDTLTNNTSFLINSNNNSSTAKNTTLFTNTESKLDSSFASDDYSYRDIVEDWASAIMYFNNKSTTTSSSNNKFNNETGHGHVVNKRTQRTFGKKHRRSVCRISEFSCARGNKCVSSDKYCDTVDDCGDSRSAENRRRPSGKRSDEPVGCTPCNRTYYGEWGSTYTLSLSSETIFGHPNPNGGIRNPVGSSNNPGGGGGVNMMGLRSGIPNQFVCQLTFAAAGDDFGDLVQIMFDSINIGQYGSSMIDGCPAGSLQVAEISRPITGGHWCGSGSGLSVYYSEMSAIALTLSVGGNNNGNLGSTKSQNGNASTTMSSLQIHQTNAKGDKTVITNAQQPIEFDFKIRYKFIPKSLAVVRYGLPNAQIERGELVPGTYCSRVLDSCHQKRCKIQSPNYPGLYPRNVSCYFTIRQRETPKCKKVLIQVIQLKPHKVQLRSIPGRTISSAASGLASGSGVGSSAGSSTIQDSTTTANLHDNFLAWEDCTGSRDGLIIYDGTTTDDPVLLKICGGSYIPPITSSGAGILIAFHSTPFGNPLEPKPPAPYPTPLRGFELDVDIVVVDSLSADYSNHKNCTFIFTSKKPEGDETVYNKYYAQEYGGNWIAGKVGTVKNPRHTLAQNTTCRYEFHGSKHESIWIYFVSYRRVLIKDSKEVDGNCTTRLRIMDGLDSRNEVTLATYCDNELPKLCDRRTLENETRVVRACTIDESFISAGSKLIVEQQFLEGTALRHLHYHFNYEFVSRHTSPDGTCNRRYHSSKMRSHGSFRTTDNVFDFGRGGRTNISCTTTIVMGSYESFHVTIRNSSFGDKSRGRTCQTSVDLETGRYTCHYETSKSGRALPKSEIRLYEYIWPLTNATAHDHCICGNVSGQSFTFLGRKIELEFTVENMQSDESYETFFAQFDYRVVKGGGCRPDNHHEYKKSTGGIITLESTFVRGLREKIPTCESYPWLLQGIENHSLYLRIPGFTMIEDGRKNYTNGTTAFLSFQMPERPCPTTKNRIFIYDGQNKLVQKICPSSVQIGAGVTGTSGSPGRKVGQVVELYSEDFHQFNSPLYKIAKSTFLIEFIGRELGTYKIHWLEVMSARMKIALQTMERDERRMGEAAKAAAGVGRIGNVTGIPLDKKAILEDPLFKSMFENGDTPGIVTSNFVHLIGGAPTEAIAPCPYYCPELNACIHEKLWCDGETHCPISEADEKSCDSFWLTIRQLMSPSVYVPIAAAIISAIICCMLVLTCLGLKRLIIVKTSSLADRSNAGRGNGGESLSVGVGRRRPSDRVPRGFLIEESAS